MKDLVQIIKDNPGCFARIDNDNWTLYKVAPSNNPIEDECSTDWDKWEEQNTLADSDQDLKPLGDGGYGSGNCYGGDILQALAIIVGVTIESV
jgi:hypothetical protein